MHQEWHWLIKLLSRGLMNEEKLVALAKEEQIDGVIHPCSEVAMNVMGASTMSCICVVFPRRLRSGLLINT